MRDIPSPLSPLVDREQELGLILDWLRRPDVRLITLTGTAGTGKTRLVLEAALISQSEFRDGAVFLDLSGLSDPSYVAASLAEALGIRRLGRTVGARPGGRSPRISTDRQLLLVIDNFEHLLTAALDVAEALHACPGAKALVTSRAALRIRGERELPVPPLTLPNPAAALDAIAVNPAVRMFVSCAQGVRPDFVLDASNAELVADICVRLDGLPLALELAAVRTRMLTPSAILQRVERRLDLLTGGARDLPPRQQTLRAALSWSYDLLSADEQRLFHQLAVFEGGCTFEAIRAVCQVNDSSDAAVAALMECLAALVDNNLVRLEPIDGQDEPRCRMLETIREFALEHLQGDAEQHERVGRRHARYFLELAERVEPTWLEDRGALAWLLPDSDNVRAALRWASEHGDIESGLRLAGALGPLWSTGRSTTQGRAWLQRLLGQTAADEATPARARALWLAGRLAMREQDTHAAEVHLRGALGMARTLADPTTSVRSLYELGAVHTLRADFAAARECFRECVDLCREAGEARGLAWSLFQLAFASLQVGALDEARRAFDESLDACRRAASMQPGAAWLPLESLALLATELGELGLAEELLEECLADPGLPADRRRVALALDAQAGLAAAHEEAARALCLGAAADALRPVGPSHLAAVLKPLVSRRLDQVRANLHPRVAEAALARGRTMDVEQALAAAREHDGSDVEAPEAAHTRAAVLARLTPREREVLDLLTRGHRNREIADALVISERTAEWHVGNVLSKLALDSRAQLVRWISAP